MSQLRREQARFWRDSDTGGLELLRARYITHAFTRHTHDTFAIGVVEAGGERFAYRGAEHVAPAGSIILINPGEPHTGQATTADGWAYRMLYPAPELLAAVAELAGQPGQRRIPFFAAPVVHDPAVAHLLRVLHLALEQPAPALERQTRLLAALGALIARHADDPPAPRPAAGADHAVNLARDYLETHYTENVPLHDLAQVAGLSPYHLVRVFRRATGLPPHAYLLQARVARAKTLLARGWPPVQVAHATGFADQSHFTRGFARIVGVTPGRYQAASRG
ncbi:MAG: AraC family ligand binding domain-containing protein [Thermomicrobiales bacterium]